MRFFLPAFVFFTGFLFFGMSSPVVYAQSGSFGTGPAGATAGSLGTGTVASPTSLINPLKSGTSLPAFLNSILDFVIKIGSIVIIFMVVYAGFKFVVAQGAPAKIDEAKQMLLWVIIGALVLLGAKGISLGILSTVQALGG